LYAFNFSWILNHIDCFVSQSQGNKSVKSVSISPYAFNCHDEDAWDKIGQAVGNLQALETLHFSGHDNYDEGGSSDEHEDSLILDWEIVAQILRQVRQSVTVIIESERLWTIEEVQALARAIRGHPSITSFEDSGMFSYESLDTLCSALATLPALESVLFGVPERFGASEVRQVDGSTSAHTESLTELLRVPSLRFVRFRNFSFTRAFFKQQ
jgi:hypothetical protein